MASGAVGHKQQIPLLRSTVAETIVHGVFKISGHVVESDFFVVGGVVGDLISDDGKGFFNHIVDVDRSADDLAAESFADEDFDGCGFIYHGFSAGLWAYSSANREASRL